MFIIFPVVIIAGIIAWILRPRKDTTNSQKIVIFSVIVPTFTLAIAAIIFQIYYKTQGNLDVANLSNTLFIIGIGVIGMAILASVYSILVRKRDIAIGIGFGICIAVVMSVVEVFVLESLVGV